MLSPISQSQINSNPLAALKQFHFRLFDYAPQESQRQVHESSANVIIVSGGEGGGKSVLTSAEVGGRFGTWGRVLFVCYKAESAKNEGDYLYNFLNKLGVVKKYRSPKGSGIEMDVINGAKIESVSTHQEGERAVSGTGKNYDIICMLEAGKQSYAVFLSCLLRASRLGALLLLSGTIERSEPWFPDLIAKLQSDKVQRDEMKADVCIVPTWANRTLYPGGREDPKIKLLERTLGKDLFNERLGGMPTPSAALIFKEFSYLTHVFDWVQFDPTCEVQLAIDPGYSGSHYSVNFIQEHPRAYTRQFYPKLPDVSVIDVWVIAGLYLDHAVHEQVIAICQNEQPYATYFSRVSGGVGDIVMKTHPMADRAPIDVWREKGNIFLRGQLVGIQDGIDRHHTFLLDPQTIERDPVTHVAIENTGYPRIFFHPSVLGVEEYRKWSRVEIGDDLWGAPEKINCDFTKSIQYYLIDRFGRIEQIHPERPMVFGDKRTTLAEHERVLPNNISVAVVESNQQDLHLRTTQINRLRNPYVVIPRKPRRSPV